MLFFILFRSFVFISFKELVFFFGYLFEIGREIIVFVIFVISGRLNGIRFFMNISFWRY